MNEARLRPETEATLLLCGGLAATRQEEPVEPLNVREFTKVTRLLDRLEIPLSRLLAEDSRERICADPEGAVMLNGRVGALLDRGTRMAIALERWTSQGLWVLDRTDPHFPRRYHEVLGDAAPPLLYGAGDIQLLNTDAPRLAVVGSRDIDPEAERFARDVGRLAARSGAVTVSGGAKGVDRVAMSGVLDEGGHGIVILPSELERVATSRVFRGAISDGDLVVASPYHPRARFTAGNAMGRNRLIYSLADVALVVSSGDGSGGTLSGAIDTLRNGWVPVCVRQSDGAPAGNRALLDHGANPVERDVVDSSLAFETWLQSSIEHASRPR